MINLHCPFNETLSAILEYEQGAVLALSDTSLVSGRKVRDADEGDLRLAHALERKAKTD